MQKTDKAIYDIDRNICNNIKIAKDSGRGLLSQNILSQLRNFVEYIAVKVYDTSGELDPLKYENNKQAVKHLKTNGKAMKKTRFLCEFHKLLQISASHYTLDEENSERLMLKYYEYLIKTKSFLLEEYNMEVLKNIEDFPLQQDPQLYEYYLKISEKIITPSSFSKKEKYNDRYYIQKIKPFFINQEIYYEVTFSLATERSSKFDRIIAFTNKELIKNYASKFSISSDYISVLDKQMKILIIDDWSVSIRPCELNNFSDIFGQHSKITSSSKEYSLLMNYLTETKMTLSSLVLMSDKYFNNLKDLFKEKIEVTTFFDILEISRQLIQKKDAGSNVILYLLEIMNNKIIKKQISRNACNNLSGLFLNYGCIPFDDMPYCSGLKGHNPKIEQLYKCIDSEGREDEIFARYIKNNIEVHNKLFTNLDEIQGFNDVEALISKYNEKIYYKHEHRKLKMYKNHVYISESADDSFCIMKHLQELTSEGVNQYKNSVEHKMIHDGYIIDCEQKKEILRNMFESSKVSLIYGAAGTGKSTLINHISHIFADKKKIYLANTNPAVDNLKKKVQTKESSYKTIASFLSDYNTDVNCTVLFIDECSTVSNSDMAQILKKAQFELIVLVGDVYQIESISFGNWFDIARFLLPKHVCHELKSQYRSNDSGLIKLWDSVREIKIEILELLLKNNYSTRLDNTIFEKPADDQIILCLNYDGLYGINNINRFLQESNDNLPVEWGTNIYKIGDPILFNESNKFTPLIYNNMKGIIKDIEVSGNYIYFTIEVDLVINEIDAEEYSFELLNTLSQNGKSLIKFRINKYPSTDEDDDDINAVIPFQIAYAVSIHKAQGLEYNTVKIVITNEAEERITHNIFYTAITRAKEGLIIYWSPETELQILQSLKHMNNSKDGNLLKQLYPELIKI